MSDDDKLRFRVVEKPKGRTIARFRYIDDAYDYQSRQHDSAELAVYDDWSGTPQQWQEE